MIRNCHCSLEDLNLPTCNDFTVSGTYVQMNISGASLKDNTREWNFANTRMNIPQEIYLAHWKLSGTTHTEKQNAYTCTRNYSFYGWKPNHQTFVGHLAVCWNSACYRMDERLCLLWIKEGAPFCYCAYVLRISGWSKIFGFLKEFAY